MSRKVKVSGQWRDVKTKYRRIGGKWRQIAASYKKINGQWRQIFAAQYPVGLYELNTDNLVGSYSISFEASGQYVASINGYCADPNRPIMVGFRFQGVPENSKFEFDYAAYASSVHANFQMWTSGSLENSFNGGSGGTSFYYAASPIDLVYRISATAETGAVSASLTVSNIRINNVAL